jgi:hypothetical protein
VCSGSEVLLVGWVSAYVLTLLLDCSVLVWVIVCDVNRVGDVVSMFCEGDDSQWFCENVGGHVRCLTILHFDLSILDQVLEKVVLDINVFCPLLVTVVVFNEDSSLIVLMQ